MASDDATGGVPDSGSSLDSEDQFTFDTSVAHQARIYDYWLGGKDNFAADREAAEEAIAAYPAVASGARANRQFLARAVRHLVADEGIRQFLDIGTGIPSANNTHEVAQSVAADCRVVYTDYDPVVLAHARALLASHDQGATDYLDADLRDTDTILAQAAKTLDFSRPVAIMLFAILHAIGDDEDPYRIVAKLLGATVPGSFLVLSHPASDIDPEKIAEATSRLNRLSLQQFTLRTHAEASQFFDGLELARRAWSGSRNGARSRTWTPSTCPRCGAVSPARTDRARPSSRPCPHLRAVLRDRAAAGQSWGMRGWVTRGHRPGSAPRRREPADDRNHAARRHHDGGDRLAG